MFVIINVLPAPGTAWIPIVPDLYSIIFLWSFLYTIDILLSLQIYFLVRNHLFLDQTPSDKYVQNHQECQLNLLQFPNPLNPYKIFLYFPYLNFAIQNLSYMLLM